MNHVCVCDCLHVKPPLSLPHPTPTPKITPPSSFAPLPPPTCDFLTEVSLGYITCPQTWWWLRIYLSLHLPCLSSYSSISNMRLVLPSINELITCYWSHPLHSSSSCKQMKLPWRLNTHLAQIFRPYLDEAGPTCSPRPHILGKIPQHHMDGLNSGSPENILSYKVYKLWEQNKFMLLVKYQFIQWILNCWLMIFLVPPSLKGKLTQAKFPSCCYCTSLSQPPPPPPSHSNDNTHISSFCICVITFQASYGPKEGLDCDTQISKRR